MLYDVSEKIVTCGLCNQRCVIRPNCFGKCGVRQNLDGLLYSLVYGQISAEQIDPVEKKPLFHFQPGTMTYSIATTGCNFKCLYCQNHSLSQNRVKDGQRPCLSKSPEEVVKTALHNHCKSISYTYVEPTIFFEFAYDCGIEAGKNKLKNIFVSNGYMSTDAAEMLVPVLDGINIDIKAFSDSFYQDICGAEAGVEQVLENVRFFRQQGIWVEVTTLLIPGLNDSDSEISKIAEFIAEIDTDVPWHVSAFRPSYKMFDRPPTPTQRLIRAREIGLASGLKYVYVGNVHTGNGEDTICPSCQTVLIKRIGFRVVENILLSGKCPGCDSEIAGFW